VTSGTFGYDPGVGIVEIVVLDDGVGTGVNASAEAYARMMKREKALSLTEAWSGAV
jgi:hypothetical protein